MNIERLNAIAEQIGDMDAQLILRIIQQANSSPRDELRGRIGANLMSHFDPIMSRSDVKHALTCDSWILLSSDNVFIFDIAMDVLERDNIHVNYLTLFASLRCLHSGLDITQANIVQIIADSKSCPHLHNMLLQTYRINHLINMKITPYCECIFALDDFMQLEDHEPTVEEFKRFITNTNNMAMDSDSYCTDHKVMIGAKNIDELKKTIYDGKVQGCSICQFDVEPGDSIYELPCKHIFHGTDECHGIYEWLTLNQKCPNCNVEVVIKTK
jgi:hypothetical protein